MPGDHIAAIYDRAIAYEAQEDDEAALREYRAIIRRAPEFFIAYLSAARALVRLGEPQAALELLREAQTLTKSDPAKQVWLHLDLGKVYEATGQSEAAIQEYNQAVGLDSALVTPHLYLASLYEEMGVLDAAYINYQELVKISEAYYNPSWAHELFAGFLYRIGDYDQAIEHYTEALRYPGYDASLLHTHLGLTYAAADEREFPDKEARALAEFEAALKNPGSNEHYIRSVYGNVLVQFGKFNEAIAQLERSLELDPGTPAETMLNLGQLYEADGKPEKACALYRRIVELGEKMPSERLHLAQERLERLGNLCP